MDTKLVSRNVALPPDLDKTVRSFCATTHRTEAHTMRAIIRLFFAEGPEMAEKRLIRNLWDPPADKAVPGASLDQVADHAAGPAAKPKRRKPGQKAG